MLHQTSILLRKVEAFLLWTTSPDCLIENLGEFFVLTPHKLVSDWWHASWIRAWPWIESCLAMATCRSIRPVGANSKRRFLASCLLYQRLTKEAVCRFSSPLRHNTFGAARSGPVILTLIMHTASKISSSFSSSLTREYVSGALRLRISCFYSRRWLSTVLVEGRLGHVTCLETSETSLLTNTDLSTSSTIKAGTRVWSLQAASDTVAAPSTTFSGLKEGNFAGGTLRRRTPIVGIYWRIWRFWF